MRDGMHVVVVEPQAIYRRGLVECLRTLPSVARITDVGDVAGATAAPGFRDADLVIVDHGLPGAAGLLRDVGRRSGVEAIVLLARPDGDVVDAVQAGAVGFLAKDTLTPDALAGAVHAAANGSSVIAPALLAGLAQRRATGAQATAVTEARLASLTVREQQVLSLIADGHPTREVAERLCYSERTVKNVLHDAVTKLGVRSRSQAVAHAVRDGLI
jgi:DNA-binding NarL/FixJ family response regulator